MRMDFQSHYPEYLSIALMNVTSAFKSLTKLELEKWYLDDKVSMETFCEYLQENTNLTNLTLKQCVITNALFYDHFVPTLT